MKRHYTAIIVVLSSLTSSSCSPHSQVSGNIDSGLSDASTVDSGPSPYTVCDPTYVTWGGSPGGTCIVRSVLPVSALGLGSFGYMASVTPPCFVDHGEIASADVVATADGVFVLSTGATSQSIPPVYPARNYTLLFNNGSGWTNLVDGQFQPGYTSASHLAISSAGEAYMQMSECALQQLLPQPSACKTQSGISQIHSGSSTLFGLRSDAIVAFNGSTWTVLHSLPTTSGTPLDFWTDGTDSVVVGSNQLVLRTVGGVSTEIVGAPVDTYDSVFAVSVDDFWITGFTGAVHYQAGTFVPFGLPAAACGVQNLPIRQFVSMGGNIFYATRREFGRVTSSGYEPLMTIPCALTLELLRIAASPSRNEVFLVLSSPDESFTACGATHVVVYDGSTFHEF